MIQLDKTMNGTTRLLGMIVVFCMLCAQAEAQNNLIAADAVTTHVEGANNLIKSNPSGYTGEKLSLIFQKVDVRDVLNVIADFTQLNIVISDSVSGNITLRLKDVPWDQALDIILQSRGLDMRRNGNVIQVAPREELAAREKLDLATRQDISDLGELHTESFQLSYQQGADVLAILSGGANNKQSILSKRGSVVIDKYTNILFAQDTPARLDGVRKMIKQIDIPVRQVQIEARIIDANVGVIRDIGVNLAYRDTDPRGFAIGSSSSNAMRGQVGADIKFPGTSGTVGTVGGQFTASLFNAAATKLLNVTINAMETDNKGKIISNPRLITGDNIEATIEQGQEIPYTVSSTTGSPTTSFKKATLSLKVTPKITPDGNVNLKVSVTDDTIGAVPAGSTVPALNTKRVETTVRVEDGGTVVLGGIYKQTNKADVGKVPLLGDIPVIGALFRQERAEDARTEMLIFITPRIIKDGDVREIVESDLTLTVAKPLPMP
ncbi:MAG: type IV pilus secretin PilQ [Rhodocyclaceae bacterium]|nr:type IV pilus secretin PilQ [Rhodocyclaceae bacterium]